LRVLAPDALTGQILAPAVEVHQEPGLGFLTTVDTACLCQALERAGLVFETEAPVPVTD